LNHSSLQSNGWTSGCVPVAVVMISLNEGHNMDAVCQNLRGWAQEVFVVDSYSKDDTVDIALRYGVHVVQRRFRGFGDQWNFALRELPINAPWVMKLDPDERLTDELKHAIGAAIARDASEGISLKRRLCFMGKPLPVRQTLTRLWRRGACHFTDVTVNEYPVVQGKILHVSGDLLHHDSPSLHHWMEKQNRYTTAEASMAYQQVPMADNPHLLGSNFQRRMWLKKYYARFPCCYVLIFLYHWIGQGAWRAGWVGYAWARLRSDVPRFREYKRREMEMVGDSSERRFEGPGTPDERVFQYE